MSQNIILTVTYNNGDITLFDVGTFVSAQPFGESLMSELTLGFSDIKTDGLWIYLHRYEMVDEGKEDGISGQCVPAAAMRLLSKTQLETVASVSMGGRDMLFRMDGELLNLAKLERQSQIYLSPDAVAGGYFSIITTLYQQMEREIQAELAKEYNIEPEDVDYFEIEEAVARQLGISARVLQNALNWMPPVYASSYAPAHEAQISAEDDEREDEDDDE